MEDLIRAEHIVLNAECASKEEVFKLVAQLAVNEGVAQSASDIVADLFERESEMATGINDGFAIPHTKSPHVLRPAVMFVRTCEPIEWETLDGSDVTRVIALLVPSENEGNLHLKMIANLAGNLMNREFTEFLSTEADADRICERIAATLTA